MNSIANTLRKTIVESAKNYCNSVSDYYAKTQPKLMELGSNAFNSVVDGVKDLITNNTKSKKYKEEMEKLKKQQSRKRRNTAIIVGSVSLVVGGVAGYVISKKNSIEPSDFVYTEDVKATFAPKPKEFGEKKVKGFLLSTDGTTFLKKA